MRGWLWVVSCLALGGGSWAFSAEPAPSTAIGSKVGDLEFKDIRYLTRSLDEFGKRKAYVFVALNSACPVAKRYLPVLSALEKQYRGKGVQFVGLNVSPDDSISVMAADAVEAGVEFPFVKDVEGRSAKSLGFKRTPEVAVLTADRVLVYRGRIDDQFRVGGERSSAIDHPLRDAIDEVLAGKPVSKPETPVDGCLITWTEPSPPTVVPTFAEKVAPILRKHCVDCHRPGAEAPFPLLSHRDVAAQAEMIAEVVTDRRMPPWYADERVGRFSNHRRLSESERETIVDWVRGGMPKGDLTKLPSAPPARQGRWSIGEPDLVTSTPFDQTIPATGFVDYRYIIFPYVFANDAWVQGVEILPDNPKIVHHANLAYIKIGERPSDRNFITGRVPGGDPMMLDDGVAVFIPKGSMLVLQTHLTTTGKPERTKISVGLKFPRVPVRKRLYHQQVHTNRYEIPPYAPAHEVVARRSLDFDATGMGLFSHMHVRGKDMTFLAKRPDGKVETLLAIPNYSFDWQQSYRWAPGSMKFPKGTIFEVIAHFDNSEFNPYNPDPSVKVRNGDQTVNEMMYGFYFYTHDDENLGLKIDVKTGAAIP